MKRTHSSTERKEVVIVEYIDHYPVLSVFDGKMRENNNALEI